MVVLVIRAEEEDATRKENLRLRPYKRQQQRSEKMRFYHAAPKETMMKIYAACPVSQVLRSMRMR